MAETIRDRLVLEIGSKIAPSAADGERFINGMIAAATAAIAALAGLTVYLVSTGDAAAKGARGVDQSVESYQRLSIAAGFAGAEAQAVFAAVGAGNERLGAAAAGNEGLAEAFEKIGISAKDAVENGQSFADLLPQVLDGLKGLSQAERSFYGGQLVGGEAVRQMASLIEGGAAGLNAAFAEADKSGSIMTKAQTDASEALADSFTSVQLRVKGLAISLGSRLVPAVDRLIRAGIELFDRFSPVIFTALDTAGAALAATIDALTSPFAQLAIEAGILALSVWGLSAAIAFLSTTAWASSAAWSWFVVAFSAGSLLEFMAAATIGFVELGAAIWTALAPLLPWVAAAVLAAAAIDDLLTYMAGGDSLFGRWTDALTEGSGLYLALSSFGDLVGSVAGLVGSAAGLVGAGFTAMWESGKSFVSGLLSSFSELVSGLGPNFDWLKGWLDVLSGAFSQLGELIGNIPQNFARGAAYLSEVAKAQTAELNGEQVFTREEQIYGSAREALAARANRSLQERGEGLAASRGERRAMQQPAAAPVTVNVNPAPGMSEEQIGRAAGREATRSRRGNTALAAP